MAEIDWDSIQWPSSPTTGSQGACEHLSFSTNPYEDECMNWSVGFSVCKNCSSNEIFDDEEFGQVVCRSCGVVQSMLIDTGAEWNNYDNESGGKNPDASRCGMPQNKLLSDKSKFSTQISKPSYKATVSSTNNQYAFKNLCKWQASISLHHKDRSLLQNFEKIQSFCTLLDITHNVAETAKSIFAVVSKHKLSRGNMKDGVIASCIYFACNNNNAPRNVTEISNRCGVSTKYIHKTNKLLTGILWQDDEYKQILFNCKNPKQFASRYCFNLNLQDRYLSMTLKMCDYFNTNFKEFIQCHEASYTATCIIWHVIQYFGIDINKTVLCNKCNLSIVTLNKIISDMNEIEDFNGVQNAVFC